MVKKIAIIGTHSAGKTTLSYLLAAKFKKENHNVKIIQEVARSCPYALNEGMSWQACLWIYHEHMRKEIEAMQKFDTIICDRSCIDSFIYAEVKGCFHLDPGEIDHNFAAACKWMESYNKIIYVKPNGMLPVDDGVRSTDVEFQKKVEFMFDIWMQKYGVLYGVHTISSELIFDDAKISDIYKLL